MRCWELINQLISNIASLSLPSLGADRLIIFCGSCLPEVHWLRQESAADRAEWSGGGVKASGRCISTNWISDDESGGDLCILIVCSFVRFNGLFMFVIIDV